jgi:hypothetical protein
MTRPTFDELLASMNGDTPDGYDADLLNQLTDWHQFWNVDHNTADWLIEPLIASGRGHAIFAPGGTGKSLLALWLAANAATGGPALTIYPRPPVDVLYLDYEMTNADLAERLENMGYSPETGADLTHLHYALLPSLPPLDRPEGGKAVIRLAELVDAQLVVFDTHARAVAGKENDADTIRDFYRCTGLHLKAEGRAFARVDHAGKDLEKGQRGSSAKSDDVDIVWQMTKGDAGAFTLKNRKTRMGWVPKEVTVTLHDDPTRYTLAAGAGYPAGTADLAATMDELAIPVDASQRAAGALLRDAGKTARSVTLRAAIRYRREEAMRLLVPCGQLVDDTGIIMTNPRPFSDGRGISDPAPKLNGREQPKVPSTSMGAAMGADGRGAESTTPRAPLLIGGAGWDHPQKHPDYTHRAQPDEPLF